jgi:toxin ParE1/3/4
MANSAIEIIVRKEAEEDIREAYQYYNECSEGLGSDFLLSIDAILSLIQRNPEIFQKVYKQIRRGLIERFPYGVFYLTDEDRIIVLSVTHCRCDPRIWQTRL